MVKNATKLYYPIKQAIMSILPIVDEFVVAVGNNDPDDRTREEILSINSPKVRIIDTVWDLEKYSRGTENAHQTDIAKNECTGDWLFYLQSDEVVHEKYLPIIEKRCRQLVDDKEVEGLLFKYRHFWGDYKHCHNSHSWYPNEIRIVRNDPEIHSWESAQSFRRIPNFDGKDYRIQEGTHKLKVATVDAYIYHYGWVRPPQLMQSKRKALDTIHKGEGTANQMYDAAPKEFDYGPLNKLPLFQETHPEVMKDWITRFNWGGKLQYTGEPSKDREPFKHEKCSYKALTFVEQKIMGGKQLFGFKNYELLKR